MRGHVEFLEEVVSKAKGEEAGKHAVRELVRLMNERMPDPAYHVTADFEPMEHLFLRSHDLSQRVRRALSGRSALSFSIWQGKVHSAYYTNPWQTVFDTSNL
jgi:hypothetical protein